MKHISLIRSMLGSGLLALALAAGANEPAATDDSGLSLDDKLTACAACHGEHGAKPIMPEYPILAGQHADYLAESLRAYRDGRRKNPIMSAQIQALELSDADIDQLAKHFSAQQGVHTLHE